MNAKTCILTLLMLMAAVALPSCKKAQKLGPVPYKVAYHYAYKGQTLQSTGENRGQHSDGVNLLSRPCILSADEMVHLFEADATGEATPIDFGKNFAIAVVLGATTTDTELLPGTLYATPDGLVLDYSLRTGGELQEPSHPVLLIVVDREYAAGQVRTTQN